MQAVSITGYFATGSGAVYNLLQEYDTISDGKLTSFEHVFLYDNNGVFETVDKLLYNNRLFNSNSAIDSFRKEMNRLYNVDFNWFGGYKYRCGKRFLDIIEEFINTITEYHSDFYWYGKYVKRKTFLTRLVKDSVSVLINRKRYDHTFGTAIVMDSNNCDEYSFATEEKLKEATKKLIKQYIILMYPEYNQKTVILNQLLQPFDAYRMNSYVPEDVKMIIVDRDIRDIYITNTYTNVWSGGRPFPKEVDKFVEFMKAYRKQERPTQSSDVLRIKFEDLIYNYETTKSIIESFVGISPKNHINPKRYFNPQKSIKNTQIFRSNNRWEKEICIIEKELKDFTFDFPYCAETSVQELFDD